MRPIPLSPILLPVCTRTLREHHLVLGDPIVGPISGDVLHRRPARLNHLLRVAMRHPLFGRRLPVAWRKVKPIGLVDVKNRVLQGKWAAPSAASRTRPACLSRLCGRDRRRLQSVDKCPSDLRPALQGSHYRPWLRSGSLRWACLGGCEKMGQTMKHNFSSSLISSILLCVAAPTLVAQGGTAEPLSCADHSITARAVRSPEGVEAFVQCAYEFVQEMGFEEARRAFNEDERWKSGQIYVFVDEATPMSDLSRPFVFPPDPSREGLPWGLLIDAFGNDWYREQHRIVNSAGDGWIYYSFLNPATGRDEPKASYLKSIDWDGALATIGAGIYRRDLPGTCRSEEVNAMGLDADPSKEKLQEFVRCAAMELESQGYFAVRSLTTDPRWGNGSIYLFGVDAYGSSLFNGDPFSRLYGVSELDPYINTSLEGQDLVSVGDAFGESFLYYSAVNPSTRRLARKVTFVKRVVVYGLPILVGSGYYPDEGP